MEHWRQVLPVPLLEVDYEETVADLEGVARRLVGWCGLEWEPACLSFTKTKQPIRTASVTQVPAADLYRLGCPLEELRDGHGTAVCKLVRGTVLSYLTASRSERRSASKSYRCTDYSARPKQIKDIWAHAS